MDLKELTVQSAEIRHPWETSRSLFFERLLSKQSFGSKPIHALDIGSGDTWVARRLLNCLPKGSSITCVDQSYTPAQTQHFSGSGITALTKIPEGARFDLALLLDVVEHVEDDRGFLNSIKSHVRDDGLLVISVPAYQALFSAHDRWLAHFRRYSPTAGRRLIDDCDLQILEEGSLFHWLIYIRMLEKFKEAFQKREKKFGVSHWNKGALVTNLILWTLNFDWRTSEVFRLLGIQVPGLSWWCVCRKRL